MAGYKLFATGDVLTAAQVNTFLMRQTTMVFADSAARATALTGVLTEGMLTYLTDTNSLEYYDGSAFQPVSNPGDITGVTAGTGISGGGASGDVTITNAMATAIDAKGDLIPGTGADTFGRLVAGANETRLVADSSETTGLKYVADTTNFAIAAKGDLLVGTAADTLAALTVGANGTTLVADSTETTGLKWAAPTGGGKILQVVSATKTDTSSLTSATFTDISGLSVSITPSAATSKILVLWSTSLSSTSNSTGNKIRIMRDSTAVGIGDTASNRPRITGGFYIGDIGDGAPHNFTTVAGNFLDAPATTSALTYKLQFSAYSAATIYVNRTVGDRDNAAFDPRCISTITVMEVGA